LDLTQDARPEKAKKRLKVAGDFTDSGGRMQ